MSMYRSGDETKIGLHVCYHWLAPRYTSVRKERLAEIQCKSCGSRVIRTAIQDTCDHVVARRLHTRIRKGACRFNPMLSTDQSKASANSPEEVRRRRERHELAGVEVLIATIVNVCAGAKLTYRNRKLSFAEFFSACSQLRGRLALHCSEIFEARCQKESQRHHGSIRCRKENR